MSAPGPDNTDAAIPCEQPVMIPINEPMPADVAAPVMAEGQVFVGSEQPISTVTAVPVSTSIAQPLVVAEVAQPVMMTQPVMTRQTQLSTSVYNWGPYPMRVICAHCQSDITTSREYKTVGMTHAACCLLCFIGCWPCACIPYCTDSCKGVVHSCPNCKRQLGQANPDF